MKYFTRGLAGGEFTDEESEAVVAAYHRHLQEITPRLPPELVRLATEIQLHDAVIDRVRINRAAKTLNLSLLGGDLDQPQYCLVELAYSGAGLGDGPVEVLRRCARDRETTILDHEIDIDPRDGTFEHRILFDPEGEISIWFDRMTLNVTPRPDRRVQLGAEFLECE